MAYVVTAYVVMAYVVMAHVFMAYVSMALYVWPMWQSMSVTLRFNFVDHETVRAYAFVWSYV